MRPLSLVLALSVVAFGGIKHSFDRPVFVYRHHPDLPISRYAAGNLGIPGPNHARLYLYAAYRYLDGRPFTAAEQKAFLEVFRLRTEFVPPDEQGARAWEAVRARVPVPRPAAGKNPRDPDYIATRGWVYQQVCGDDAYAVAAATLRDRLRRFGPNSAWMRLWVEGQDAVFQSCHPGPAQIPAAAPAGAPPLIRADREYQIGAALFYSQRLDDAYAQFERVAKDTQSPWRVWAPYLLGRVLLWKARLTQDENSYRPLLSRAERQFLAVLADPKLRLTHAAAERLLIRCMLITNPARALARLAKRLDSPASVATRATDLYTYLSALDTVPQGQQLPGDPLSRWTRVFQSATGGAGALREWRRTKSPVWLYAAVGKVDVPELVEPALAVPLEAPAGPAFHFWAARLLAAGGDFTRAREELAAVLSRLDAYPSARNHALTLLTQLAPDLGAFLRVAPRRVILASDEMDADEFRGLDKADPGQWREAAPELARRIRKEALQSAGHASQLAKLDRLDLTGAAILNTRLPLDLLRAIGRANNTVPPHLLNELRLVVWTRAVLLRRMDVAREFAPLVTSLYPVVEPEMRGFVSAAEGAPAEGAAALVLLKLPGARPYMSWAYGRDLPAVKHDEWGRNWWYYFRPADMYGYDLPYYADKDSGTVLPHLAFISPGQSSSRRNRNGLSSPGRGERGLNWIALRISATVARDPRALRRSRVTVQRPSIRIAHPMGLPPGRRSASSGPASRLQTPLDPLPWHPVVHESTAGTALVRHCQHALNGAVGWNPAAPWQVPHCATWHMGDTLHPKAASEGHAEWPFPLVWKESPGGRLEAVKGAPLLAPGLYTNRGAANPGRSRLQAAGWTLAFH